MQVEGKVQPQFEACNMESVAGKRRKSRLNLDSEEEEKERAEAERQTKQIEDAKRLKKEKRQQRKKEKEDEENKKAALEAKYNQPSTMLQPDSNSDIQYTRLEQKIKKAYPESYPLSTIKPHNSPPQRSPSPPSPTPTAKPPSKFKPPPPPIQQDSTKQRPKTVVKLQQQDPKDQLVKAVAVRWWYCMPAWPPQNYPYELQLRRLGYRLVETARFRMEQNEVNGFLKVMALNGYLGIFKSKKRLLDLRPKDTCPTLGFFRSKSITELTIMLRIALNAQLTELRNLKHPSKADKQLIPSLQRKLSELSSP